MSGIIPPIHHKVNKGEPTMSNEKETNSLKRSIHVIKGLINYHKRMTLPLANMSCAETYCPAAQFENDVYLTALEDSLRLLERELGESST